MCAEVGIMWALFCLVLGVFAEKTISATGCYFIPTLLTITIHPVLLVPTPHRVLLSPATAPPHSPAPLFIMGPTAPVIVFLIVELFLTIVTHAFFGVTPLTVFES